MLSRPASWVLLLVSGLLVAGPAAAGGTAGRVVSALDGRPVAGVEVTCGGFRDTTDEDGLFRLPEQDLVPGGATLRVHASHAGFCDYEARERGGSDAGDGPREVVLIPGKGLHSSRYASFLSFFRSLTATGRPRELLAEDVTLIWRQSFHGTRVLRWRSPPLRMKWDVLAPGSDEERELFRRAVAEWEAKTGIDLFQETDDPDARLTVGFGGEDSWTRFGSPGPGGEPAWARINVSSEGNEDEVISWSEHELGHALFLLGHSRDPAHVMFGGGVLRQRVTEDEARVVRVLLGLPPGENIEDHRWPPDERTGEEGSDRAVLVASGIILIMILLAMEARGG